MTHPSPLFFRGPQPLQYLNCAVPCEMDVQHYDTVVKIHVVPLPPYPSWQEPNDYLQPACCFSAFIAISVLSLDVVDEPKTNRSCSRWELAQSKQVRKVIIAPILATPAVTVLDLAGGYTSTSGISADNRFDNALP